MSLITLDLRGKVEALQEEILQMPQASIVTTHTFKPNVYERAIRIPAWTVLTGAAHKTNYKVRLEKGTIAVNIGTEIKVLIAPCEFEAKAGAQRVGRVFDEEIVWVDVYDNPDNCKDIAQLEERLYVIPVYGLGDSRTSEQQAQIDYLLFLKQIGMTREEVQAIAANEVDLIDMPDGYAVELRKSNIHGQGLFATKDFKAGDMICPGRLAGKRTPGGRFINHSFNANIEPKLIDDDIYAFALKNIDKDDELLVDYRSSMRVNFGIVLQGELL